jgi:uncharacterized membrane protein
MGLLVFAIVLAGALIVIASGVWVAIALIRGNRHKND